MFPNEETQAAPFTLNCMYCQWSSTEIGLEFEKPTGIHGISTTIFFHLNLTDSRPNFEVGVSEYGDARGI